jgi:hypothetical protein
MKIKGIKVTRLGQVEHQGDWHDTPLRWQVTGPAAELQKFSTKAEAMTYAKIRRSTASSFDATAAFIAHDLKDNGMIER